ncbi:MAG: hypothetical protein GJ680_07550 [Alteromonadaceae bacterium]|nr:hypothetical protein [Alteromonadaceae bacterium]
MVDLFGNTTESVPKVSDFIKRRDKSGLLRHLQGLSEKDFRVQVLMAGLSMIGFHHTRPKVIEYVMGQLD